jgi:hypothetical protein
MMFIKAILAFSLVAHAVAAPLVQPRQLGGTSCLSPCFLCMSLINPNVGLLGPLNGLLGGILGGATTDAANAAGSADPGLIGTLWYHSAPTFSIDLTNLPTFRKM